MTHFAPIKTCICPLSRSLTCVHPFINNNNSKFWHKALDHKKYLVFFFTYRSLSTSLHTCIHSHITSFFCYQYDILFTHWSEDSFGGFHCDETLNVIVLAYVMTWVSHMTQDFAFSLWQDLKRHSFSLHQNKSLTCDVNFFDT